MAFELLFPIDNENNYNFDDTKGEITGGLYKLLAEVIGAEAYLYTRLDENAGLVAIDSSGNGRHGAFQGGFDETIWTTGKINSAIEGQGSGRINFDNTANFERTQAFSLECWIKFTSATNQAVIARQKNSGVFEGYALSMVSGKARFTLRDTNNISIAVESSATINNDVFRHIVCTYDGASSNTGMKVYIDNVDVTINVTIGTLTGSTQNSIDLQISGRDGNNIPLAVGSVVDEAVIYDRELTPAEISFRWNGGSGTQEIPGPSTQFPTDNPTINPIGNVLAVVITDLDADITVTGSDEIRFVMTVNNIDKYWNGSIWDDSSGYSASNTLAEMKTNLISLDLSVSSSVAPKAFAHSDDGSTTPELGDITLHYNVASPDLTINKCLVFGYNKTPDGEPDTSEITIELNSEIVKYKNDIILLKETITVTPNSAGYWEVLLIENDNMEEFSYYIFTFVNDKVYGKIVPDEAFKAWLELVDA